MNYPHLSPRIFLLLADGNQWTLEQIVPYVRDQLNPEKSLRRIPERKGYQKNARPRTLVERVEDGHRNRIFNTMRSMVGRGFVVSSTADGKASSKEGVTYTLAPNAWKLAMESEQYFGRLFTEVKRLFQAGKLRLSFHFSIDNEVAHADQTEASGMAQT